MWSSITKRRWKSYFERLRINRIYSQLYLILKNILVEVLTHKTKCVHVLVDHPQQSVWLFASWVGSIYCHNLTWVQPHTMLKLRSKHRSVCTFPYAAHLQVQVFHFVTATASQPPPRFLILPSHIMCSSGSMIITWQMQVVYFWIGQTVTVT